MAKEVIKIMVSSAVYGYENDWILHFLKEHCKKE